MKKIPLLCLLILGLAAPALAGALESSTQNTSNLADRDITEMAQIKNADALTQAQNQIDALTKQLADLKTCNSRQQLWSGSGCQSLQVTSYNILPAQQVTPNYLPPGSYSEDRSCGSCSGSGICYVSYWTCTSDILQPVVTIQGTVVTIQPKSCSTANRRRYFEPTCGPAPPAGILYNDWY